MSSLQEKITLALSGLLLLLGASCSASLSWDEEIVEAAFEAGTGVPTDFFAFEPGDPMVVHTGIQAGVWLMPVLRHHGLAGTPEIRCVALDLDKDQILAEGEGEGHTQSFKHQGWQMVQYNMAVSLPSLETTGRDDLLAYEGDRVLFECDSIDARGRTLSLSLEMILELQ